MSPFDQSQLSFLPYFFLFIIFGSGTQGRSCAKDDETVVSWHNAIGRMSFETKPFKDILLSLIFDKCMRNGTVWVYRHSQIRVLTI